MLLVAVRVGRARCLADRPDCRRDPLVRAIPSARRSSGRMSPQQPTGELDHPLRFGSRSRPPSPVPAEFRPEGEPHQRPDWPALPRAERALSPAFGENQGSSGRPMTSAPSLRWAQRGFASAWQRTDESGAPGGRLSPPMTRRLALAVAQPECGSHAAGRSFSSLATTRDDDRLPARNPWRSISTDLGLADARDWDSSSRATGDRRLLLCGSPPGQLSARVRLLAP